MNIVLKAEFRHMLRLVRNMPGYDQTRLRDALDRARRLSFPVKLSRPVKYGGLLRLVERYLDRIDRRRAPGPFRRIRERGIEAATLPVAFARARPRTNLVWQLSAWTADLQRLVTQRERLRSLDETMDENDYVAFLRGEITQDEMRERADARARAAVREDFRAQQREELREEWEYILSAEDQRQVRYD